MTSEILYPNSYNRELILDLTLGAWSVYSMDHPGFPKIHDYLSLPGYYLEDTIINGYNNAGVLVTDGAGNTITVVRQTSTDRTTDSRKERFKFLITHNTLVSLAEYRDYSFTDWVSIDNIGTDFSSYLITGYNLAGDMAREKQVVYLQIFCNKTETVYTMSGNNVVLARQSSCKVQSQWDWNNSIAQGKWGPVFQAYRFLRPQPVSPVSGDEFNYGETVITTKNKLRGRGRALSLYIQSEAGKDMKLLGWNVLATVNGEP